MTKFLLIIPVLAIFSTIASAESLLEVKSVTMASLNSSPDNSSDRLLTVEYPTAGCDPARHQTTYKLEVVPQETAVDVAKESKLTLKVRVFQQLDGNCPSIFTVHNTVNLSKMFRDQAKDLGIAPMKPRASMAVRYVAPEVRGTEFLRKE